MRKNLICERKKSNFTQAEVSTRLGITSRQYRRLEAGTSDGSVRLWEDLSELFGKTINYLLVNTKEPDGNQAE